jgi:hypothetical protein
MATTKQIITKAVEAKAENDAVDELQAQKQVLAAELAAVNARLDEARVRRNTLMDELKTLINE